MKKLFKYFLMTLLVCVCAVGVYGNKAEAAKVAVLPLVNLEEETNNAGAVFMKEAVQFFNYPAYDLIGDDVLEPILAKENYAAVGKNGPNEAMLRRIMKASGADIVIMMRLNEFQQTSDMRGKEMMEGLVIKADVMAVNAFTGKVYKKGINYSDKVEYAFIVRSDWKHDEFAKQVRGAFKAVTKG